MKTIPIPPGYLTVEQAAKVLGIEKASIRQYLLTGKFETHKLGTMTLLSEAEVKAWKERTK